MDDPVWDATVFTKNRDRLLEAEVAKEFLGRVVAHARERGRTSDELFTVDGTLLEAWASLKSFQPKERTVRLRRRIRGIPRSIFMGRSARTERTNRRAIRRRSWRGRAKARRPS